MPRAPRLILASASPRRRELLARIGVEFEVSPAHIDETRRDGEEPFVYVKRLARQKAAAVLRSHHSDTVLAADTTVVLDGNILNKPRDVAEAEAMLRSLSGRTHLVHTGIAVIQHHFAQYHVETTAVTFDTIDEHDLAVYLASGDALDKAGAYGIQGYAARWIPRIDGDYFNVVGLPLAAVVRLLRRTQIKI